MTTTTTKDIQQQSVNQDVTSHLTSNSFDVSNDMELDLESILSKEFEQGLPNDLDNPL